MWYEKYLSIPFEPNKSSMNSCDCAGLIFLILQNELGIKVERNNTVDFNAKEKHLLMKQYFNLLEEIPKEQAQAFDIFFQTDTIFHTGFIVNDKFILQSTLDRGVHLSNRRELSLKPTKYYRVKK